jgi:hypothetical protein
MCSIDRPWKLHLECFNIASFTCCNIYFCVVLDGYMTLAACVFMGGALGRQHVGGKIQGHHLLIFGFCAAVTGRDTEMEGTGV